ncbi:MAG: hypothetical protein D6743_20335 [Calditrichaeota bacterium]|nr:MAG: hypothetical protein D6743_20335 [Calditrichota bacterium]
MKRWIQSLVLLIPLWACSDNKPFIRVPGPDDRLQLVPRTQRPVQPDVLTFYVLGDWGTGDENQRHVAQALQQDVQDLPPGKTVRPFVLELGDNVYEKGLPQGWNNPEALRLLDETFGRVYTGIKYGDLPLLFHIVPGNHDYAGAAGGKEGYGDVLLQETVAEERFRSSWRYYPINPAINRDTNDSTDYVRLKAANIFDLAVPERVHSGASHLLNIVALDTQVMLELYDKKDSTRIKRNWSKLDSLLNTPSAWSMIIGHHPIRTHGWHGGFRTAFWYLPVPPTILFTLIDKLFLRRLQDLDHPAYRAFRRDLAAIMKKHDVTFYLAGHEHNLQFLRLDSLHFQLVSGSAAKRSSVTHKRDTIFSQAARGFVRFDVTEKEMWLEFIPVDPRTSTSRSAAVFRLRR